MRTRGSTLGLVCAIALGLLVLVCSPGHETVARSVTRTAQTGPSDHVVINEVAWGGSAASSADEWIELLNTANVTVSLDGWRLTAADGSPDIALEGPIPSYGYYLVERTDDETVSNIPADLTTSFGSGLNNSGETLLLRDPDGHVVDTANASGGSWPTPNGGSPDYRSMERLSPTAPDLDSEWIGHDGSWSGAEDANGDPINGTPAGQNAAFTPIWHTVSDLVARKRGPETLTSGMAANYRLTLVNYGGAPATQIHLLDRLPPPLSLVMETSGLAFTRTGQSLTWFVPSLAPEASIAFTLTAEYAPDATTSVSVTNRLTATMSAPELCTWNNVAEWWSSTSSLPTAPTKLLISGLLYDGYQYNDVDEAVELINLGETSVDIQDWELCLSDAGALNCKALPALVVASGKSVWLAQDSSAFTTSFGHAAAAELASWPRLANSGEAVLLRDAAGHIVDALVYGNGVVPAPDWIGPPLTVYSSPSLRGATGQILTRATDERTGRPVSDTNTAADWLQYAGDPLLRRRVRYPGWDLDTLFHPLSVTVPATLTLAVAPDNAFEVIAEALSRARTSIAVETYSFRHPELLDILAAKARDGVSVTLLLEGDPVGLGDLTLEWREELAACQGLESAGGACWFMIHEPGDYRFNRYDYLHAKMIIVDDRLLILGSQNLTPSSLPSDDKTNGTLGSRGTVVVVESPPVAARAREIFRLDLDPAHHDILRWNTGYLDRYGPPPPGTSLSSPGDPISYTVRYPDPEIVSGTVQIELITAPEAALRRTDALAGLLARTGAGDAVYIEQQYERLAWGTDPITDPNPRLSDYANAARRGARVRLLLNGRSFIEGYDGFDAENLATTAYLDALAHEEGLDLRAAVGDPTGAGIHNKMVLVDMGPGERYVHMGSLNGSETANKTNREVALQIRSDAAYAYYIQVFRSDWFRANPIYMPLLVRDYTPPPPPATHLLLTEICYLSQPSAEWIEVANPGPAPVDLTGYKVGDAESPEVYESMFRFPDGTQLPPGAVLVIAVNGAAVPEANLEFYESDAAVPNMLPYAAWGDPAYPFALRNEGDQVLLLDPLDRLVDGVSWGDGNLPGVISHPGISTIGASLERLPAYQDTDSCATDFRERYPPTPGALP